MAWTVFLAQVKDNSRCFLQNSAQRPVHVSYSEFLTFILPEIYSRETYACVMLCFRYDESMMVCTHSGEKAYGYTVFLVLLGIALPVLVIVPSYCRLFV